MIGDISQADAFVAERSLTGLNVGREDLEKLVNHYGLDLDRIADLLKCHPELVTRKAARWRIALRGGFQPSLFARRLPKSDAGPSPRIEAKYGDRLLLAKAYVEQRNLKQVRPSKDDLEYLYVTLGLPINILDKLFSGRIRYLLHEAGIEKRSGIPGSQNLYCSLMPISSPWPLSLLFGEVNFPKYSYSSRTDNFWLQL